MICSPKRCSFIRRAKKRNDPPTWEVLGRVAVDALAEVHLAHLVGPFVVELADLTERQLDALGDDRAEHVGGAAVVLAALRHLNSHGTVMDTDE